MEVQVTEQSRHTQTAEAQTRTPAQRRRGRLHFVYLFGFFRAFCQKGPHAALQSLHVHFLGRLGVVDLDLVDLWKQETM